MCRGLAAAIGGLILVVVAACADSPRTPLPPSDTDLPLLTPGQLCLKKAAFLEQHRLDQFQPVPWGSGQELRLSASRSPLQAEEGYFFDEDGQLVGAVFVFPRMLALKPYPVLRETLSQLKPDMEFYLPGASVTADDAMDSGVLYRTGDEKSTMQYVTSGQGRDAMLRLASVAIDPYEKLLSPYRPEFLARLNRKEGDLPAGSRSEKDDFAALQQFARGETSQLGYCGSREYDRAADAYRKALALGLPDKVRTAEAHHRLGLAYEGQGQFEQAREQMEQSLAIHPNTPEVLNNLATVYLKLGERDKGVKMLERAVSLRPNYALARYNLAEAYEAANPKRAIEEYETYLALVEGIREEADRAAKARERVKALRR